MLLSKPLAILLGIALVYLFCVCFFEIPGTLFIAILFLILSLGVGLLLLCRNRLFHKELTRRLLPLLLLLCLLFSLMSFLARGFLSEKESAEIYNDKTLDAVLLIEQLERGERYLLAEGIFTEIDGKETNIRGNAFFFINLTQEGEEFMAGDTLAATFTFATTEGNTLSDKQSLADGLYLTAVAASSEKLLSRNTVTLSMSLYQFRESIAAFLEDHLPEQAQSMMKALLLADKRDIDPLVKEGFSVLGISHLFAVSGLHLSILVGLIAKLLEALRLRQGVSYPILAAIILLYILLTGFAPSMLRAGGMLLLFYLSYFSKRKKDSVTSLLVATSVILALSPTSILDLGLLLSFLATLGILLIGTPLLSAIFQKRLFLSKPPLVRLALYPLRFLISSAVMTLSATATILPILCMAEGTLFSPAILSNLVFAPFFTLLLLLLPILLLSLPITPLFSVVAFLAEGLTQTVYQLALWGRGLDEYSFSLTYSFMPFLILALLAATIPLLLKKKGTLLPLIPVLLFFVLAHTGIALSDLALVRSESIYYHTDGKNDSLSLTYEKHGLLIDCSASSSFLRGSLSYCQEISPSVKLDTLMLTSCRVTHLSAVRTLCEGGKITHLILPKGSETAEVFATLAQEYGITVTFYSPGDTVLWNDITLTTYPDSTQKAAEAIDIALATKEVLYMRENAPDQFDIRFGPLAEHRDVILFGAFGNGAKSSPYVFDADTVVQGSDTNYMKKNNTTTLLYGDHFIKDKRTEDEYSPSKNNGSSDRT